MDSEEAPGNDSPAFLLHDAVESDDTAEMTRLIDTDADVNEPDDWFGRPPLAYARSAEAVRLLAAAGASLDWDDSQGDALDVVLAAINEEDLPLAAGLGVAQALLDAGVPLERTDRSGETRLARAAFAERADEVAFLLERGASLATDKYGATPLHKICWQGEHNPETDAKCERIIRLLVAAGISPDARDRRQGTPLDEALGGDWSNQTAAWTLLALGATVDAPDTPGRTPLYYAAMKGYTDAAGVSLYPSPGETAEARLAKLEAGLRAYTVAYAA